MLKYRVVFTKDDIPMHTMDFVGSTKNLKDVVWDFLAKGYDFRAFELTEIRVDWKEQFEEMVKDND